MKFKQSVKEALGYYVYCLVDPRDNKIFYIGKGNGDRVFDHAADALCEQSENDKLDTIRDIHKNGLEVSYYIVRHGMTNEESLLVESVLIDMLTYDKFNTESILTNIQAGHHQWDKGVKTVEEINVLYDCYNINPRPEDKLICININKTFNIDHVGKDKIYEATRRYWRLNGKRAQEANYVLAVYHGIVRAVFIPRKWSSVQFDKGKRWEFEGVHVENSEYLHTSVKKFYNRGNRNPVLYINC